MSAEFHRINLLIQRGKFQEAQSLVTDQLAKHPDDADLHLLLAEILWRRERPKEAEASARTAIGLDPDSGYPHQLLAQILLGSSNLKGAEEAVNQAIALDGDSSGCRGLLARIYAERSNHKRALEHAEAGLEIDPDCDICRFFKGIALGKLGRHEEADATALSLLGDDPDDASNHCARGWVLLDSNSPDAALMHFQEALRIEPESEDARSGLVRCLIHRNPLLGWLLRAINALERLPMLHLLVAVAIVGILLPRFLRADGMPPAAFITGQILKTSVMTFFYFTVAAAPLFSAVLLASRQGRNALGPRELKATHWSLLPLIGGLAYLGIWIAGGGKSTPFTAVGLLGTATVLFEAVSQRHPWVRQRMLAIAGLACAVAAWLLLGPWFVLKPMMETFAADLIALTKDSDPKLSPTLVKQQLTEYLEFRKNWFIYPSLALYILATSCSYLAAAILRRAPDPTN